MTLFQTTSELPTISDFPIPRRLVQCSSPVDFSSLHGFSDALQTAYRAVVYLRTLHVDTSVSTSIIFAKLRVAPLRSQTIPRLELTAAQLLSSLLGYLSKLLHLPREYLFAWSDSTIVLAWLDKAPSTLETFVRHHVAAIQETIPRSRWRHVPTNSNPADLASRGASASTLTTSSLWKKGLDWLREPPD